MKQDGPRIPEQQQISSEHQQMISDLQSIVKDLKDLYRNAVLGKKEEKDNDIKPFCIKKYDKDKSGNADITLSIKNDNNDTNKNILELLNSINNINNGFQPYGTDNHLDGTTIKQQGFYNLKDKIKSLTITRDNGEKDTLEFDTPPYNRKIQNINVYQVKGPKAEKEDKYIVFEYTSDDYIGVIEDGTELKEETTIAQFKTSNPMNRFNSPETQTYKLVIDLTNDVVYNYCQNVPNVIASDLEHSNLQKPMDTSNLHNHFRNPFFIVQPEIKKRRHRYNYKK